MNESQENRSVQDDECRQANILTIAATLAWNEHGKNKPRGEFCHEVAIAIQNAIERWAQRREP